MKSIEDHIEYDKKIADDPQPNPQQEDMQKKSYMNSKSMSNIIKRNRIG